MVVDDTVTTMVTTDVENSDESNVPRWNITESHRDVEDVVMRSTIQLNDSQNDENSLFLAARHPYREPLSRHDLRRMEEKCGWCGALHWMSEKVVHSSRSNPVFSLCYNSGQVVLPRLSAPPEPLRDLLERDDAVGRDFRESISKYNRAFAFTSLQVTEDHSVNEHHRGPPIFRIQGELHHRGGHLSHIRKPTPQSPRAEHGHALVLKKKKEFQ